MPTFAAPLQMLQPGITMQTNGAAFTDLYSLGPQFDAGYQAATALLLGGARNIPHQMQPQLVHLAAQPVPQPVAAWQPATAMLQRRSNGAHQDPHKVVRTIFVQNVAGQIDQEVRCHGLTTLHMVPLLYTLHVPMCVPTVVTGLRR